MKSICLTAASAAVFLAVPVAAKTTAKNAAPPAPRAVAAPDRCELHVWPTENYEGMSLGLLSNFGGLGALADVAVQTKQVRTIKDLMREYLGPDVQMAELDRIGFAQTLQLNGYRIVIERPTPFKGDLKNDVALKAQFTTMKDRIKSKKRASASTVPCYAELITNEIFFIKDTFYGRNLFTSWTLREFAGPLQTKIFKGQVKNSLKEFPPKGPDKVAAAKADLRDAYAKDFREWVDKKVFGSTRTASR